MRTFTIVVLNDGDTYTDVNGCSIVTVTEEEYIQLEVGNIKCADLHPLVEISLQNIAPMGED